MVWTPWEPAENLNRVAPAGVSLVVTGCSPGPPVPLNAAGGETIAWNLSFRRRIPRLTTTMKSIRKDDVYGFALPARLSSGRFAFRTLATGFDPGLRPESRVTRASWILQRMCWPAHLTLSVATTSNIFRCAGAARVE